MTAPKLVDHFFRHEYGRLVAVLSRKVGVQHIEIVEDAVQSALMAALESWTITEVPHQPSAWLFKVAHNKLVGELRQRIDRDRILRQQEESALAVVHTDAEQTFPKEIQEDMLRMLFVCCDEAIPADSQLVLALKVLCGFNVREIAIRLFTSEANVYKRLGRARKQLQNRNVIWDQFNQQKYANRLPAVNRVLYLLFTEGYLASNSRRAIRRELCEEGIRLTSILAENPVGQTPETFALLALMYLHIARIDSRLDESGDLLLLEEQDRSHWDQSKIGIGLTWLERSSQGNTFSRYHAEAGIAAEHCLAPSFQQTRWDRIASSYAMLEQLTPSPIHRLNRAVAIAEWQGPDAGLAVLNEVEPPEWLSTSCQWNAVMADLQKRCGNYSVAKRYQEEAFRLASSPRMKVLLGKRFRSSCK